MEPIVYTAQKPLRTEYKTTPSKALVVDHARTSGDSASDPFHSKVEPMDGSGIVVPIGTHAAVGGPHDAPTPGDMLCAALAACQDSTVRGTLAMDPNVPIGFQAITCEVRLTAKEGTSSELLKKLGIAAEQCCVVQQTLKAPPQVKTTFTTSGTAPSNA